MTTTPSLAMMTDQYEFTMLASAIKAGTADRRVTFEAFARRLPNGFPFGVVAGTNRIQEAISNFTFSDADVAYLRRNRIIDGPTADYLTVFRFTGTIRAYREGSLYFPNSPIVTVEGTFGECVLLETLILSILNHDCSIATKAARMVAAADGRPIIEMGSRRTHESAAMAAARAAYIAGFAKTSNTAAGKAYGLPTSGTAAHAFTLFHDTEEEAFTNQIASLGVETTLLVDTYDIPTGIRTAVEVARKFGVNGPGAIRIDSGDLADETVKARVLLDALDAKDTKIIVSSDIDENEILRLANCPVDGFGVGTQLVSTAPAGMVYKLVERTDGAGVRHSVAKRAANKVSYGGTKTAYCILNEAGERLREVFTTDGGTPALLNGEQAVALQENIIVDGYPVNVTTNTEWIRTFHSLERARLPKAGFTPTPTAESASAVTTAA